MSSNAVVLLSGGIDSAACAKFLGEQGCSVRGVFVDYGQKAATFERRSAEALSKALGMPLESVSVTTPAQFGTGEVVGRNALLVFGAMLATQPRTGVIAMGIHTGTPYYDCTNAFAQSIDRLLAEYTDGRVRFSVPFITWDKKNIFDYYQASGLPVDLTYSCESGELPTCGTCLSCLDRRMLGC
jgi:7-cyano-7-deazaguanine synthase